MGPRGLPPPLLPVPPALHLQHAWPLTAEMAISHACMALLHIIWIIYRTGKRSKIIFFGWGRRRAVVFNPNHDVTLLWAYLEKKRNIF